MITPIRPLRTKLIHISQSYWTSFRSYEIILEMGTVHGIGLQMQCSIVYTNPLLQKTLNPIRIV